MKDPELILEQILTWLEKANGEMEMKGAMIEGSCHLINEDITAISHSNNLTELNQIPTEVTQTAMAAGYHLGRAKTLEEIFMIIREGQAGANSSTK